MINDIDDGMQPMAGSIEAKDRFAVAPPGHSLTIEKTIWE